MIITSITIISIDISIIIINIIIIASERSEREFPGKKA